MFGNVGRNDPCPCRSGKKFKKCCGSPLMPSAWPAAAAAVSFQHPREAVIRQNFFALVDYLKDKPVAGGCHLLSGVFHVLLAEQGVESTLRIGEILRPDGKGFDHSWVEINGNVFDIAIFMTFDEERNPPVYAGINLGSGAPTMMKYGIRTTQGLDRMTQAILHQPFVTYMDGWPHHPRGAWSIVEEVAGRLGVAVDIPAMRTKHVNTQRVY